MGQKIVNGARRRKAKAKAAAEEEMITPDDEHEDEPKVIKINFPQYRGNPEELAEAVRNALVQLRRERHHDQAGDDHEDGGDNDGG